MARTPTVSDEDIIAAAKRVMYSRGATAFTLSEVAKITGLSRSAIILRFESTRTLKLAILGDMNKEFARKLDALPKSPSGNHLLSVAAFIGQQAGTREGSASYFSNYGSNIEDREMTSLEKQRGEILDKAVSRVMPETTIDHESAVSAFIAHLAGNLISWIASDSGSADEFLITRTKKWLQWVGIPFDDPAPCEHRGTQG